jgi:pilus assembly protein CpaF
MLEQVTANIYRDTLRYFFAPVATLLYDDPTVTEVLINGFEVVYVERRGQLERTSCRFSDPAALEAAVYNLAEYVQRPLGEQRHSLDARLPEPEKFRVHVILPPCSRNGIVVSIRKFQRAELTMERLVQTDTITELARQYLFVAIQRHRNVIVAGGTGAGKTSLLNAMSAAIPEKERIIVIEDSSELQLKQPHTIYLESRPAYDGGPAVTIRDLFVDSLRMRPDRILVGEVRRGEALDLVQSMLSGHDGAMSTVHASSPRLALVRLETLCLMSDVTLPVYVARAQVASAVNTVVQIERTPQGSRRVRTITEVLGLDERERYETRELFRREHAGEAAPLVWTGAVSDFAEEARLTDLLTTAPDCIDTLFASSPQPSGQIRR